MPNSILEIYKTRLVFVLFTFFDLVIVEFQAGGYKRTQTIGSHPTIWPPPKVLLLFRISTGRLARRATIGYAFAVPNVDSLVLSEYSMKARGFPPSGSFDFTTIISILVNHQHSIAGSLYIPEPPRMHWLSMVHHRNGQTSHHYTCTIAQHQKLHVDQ